MRRVGARAKVGRKWDGEGRGRGKEYGNKAGDREIGIHGRVEDGERNEGEGGRQRKGVEVGWERRKWEMGVRKSLKACIIKGKGSMIR